MKPGKQRYWLNRQFWLIVLTSWTMEEVEEMEQYAELVERSTSW